MARPTDDLISWGSDVSFGSGPRAGYDVRTAISAARAAQGFVAGLPFPANYANTVLFNFYEWIEHLRADRGSGWFGDGSDGSGSITGTTSLTRCTYYTDLTIGASGILQPNGYRVYVNGTLTMTAGGVIDGSGDDGSGSTAPAPTSVGPVLGQGGTGAAAPGGLSSNGVAGGNVTTNTRVGGAGGAGGDTTSFTGGAAGTGATTTTDAGQLRSLPFAAQGWILGDSGWTQINGGTGGGSGATDASGTVVAVHGGGAGGGVVVVCAKRIVLNGGTWLDVSGGDGGTATGSGEAGGGGGGGGGVALLVYGEITGTGTISAAGGAAGLGLNGGSDGTAGTAGTIIQVRA